MRILDSNKKNFYTELDKIIEKRKKINQSSLREVEKIMNNVRRNKDRALIFYEKKFNFNSQIVPTKREIFESINELDPRIKVSIKEIFQRIKK